MKEIILFGTGASEFSFSRSFSDITPAFYLDNSTQKQWSFRNNRLILDPKYLEKIDKGQYRIIVASEFHEEIADQLNGMGLEKGNDYVIHNDLIFDVSEVFLISFMKCGRTWLRFMLGNLLEEVLNKGEQDVLYYTDTPQKYSSEMPVITAFHDDNPHNKRAERLERDKSRYQNKKVVFMVRDPRDAAVSLFYHMKYRSKQYDGNIEDFVIPCVETIVEYFSIWNSQRQLMDNYSLIRYEDLQERPEAELKRLLSFLGVSATDAQMSKAVDKASFNKMKKYESTNSNENTQLKPAESSTDANSFKVRKGVVGGYKDELGENLIEELNDKYLSKLPSDFGYSYD